MSPTKDLDEFFTFMYGEVEGYVYCPVKDPRKPPAECFRQYFFAWPRDKEKLIQHVHQHVATHEVYFCPSLFKSAAKKAEKSDILGTHFVWTEFDGKTPNDLKEVPPPSVKIQSSTSEHEHWYWRLDHFERDYSKIESITKKISYVLEADLSAWDATQLLRPPGTKHHDSGLNTQVLWWEHEPFSIAAFGSIPNPPVKFLEEQDIGHIPQPLDVISKFLFPDDFLSLFRAIVVSKIEWEKLTEEQRVGKGKDRSAALTKLAHFCVEATGKDGKRMSDAEVLSILWNADERWGKFKPRGDKGRRKGLLGIINHVRSKHPEIPIDGQIVVAERLKVYNYSEFINTELKLEWAIEGLIHKKGFVMIAGPPTTGKSQFSMRFALSLAQGKSFLRWTPVKPMKLLLVSMEMPHEELLYFFEQMAVPENELLRENLHIMPLGYSLQLSKTANQAELAAKIDEIKPDGIIMDSLGAGLREDINSEKIILESFDFVNKVIRNHFGAFIWFIHHTRKEQIGNKKPKKLADLYGNQYIGAAVRTGIMLWPESPNIEVSCMKLSLAKEFSPFMIRRQPGLDFNIVDGFTSFDTDKDVTTFDGDTDLSDSI